MALDLRHARFLLSCAQTAQLPGDHGREVAFAGRSNAGKSSAINALTGVAGLARSSKTPGRTQLINLFGVGEAARIVDLPGYGYADVPEPVRLAWHALIEGYLGGRQSLQGLVLVMDVRHPLTPFDQQLVEWAQHVGIPLHALLTKADKLSKAQADRSAAGVRKALGAEVGLTLFSATKGTGKAEAQRALLAWLQR